MNLALFLCVAAMQGMPGKFYERLFEHMCDGFAVLETQYAKNVGLADFRVLGANPAMLDMLGLTQDKVVGEHASLLLPEITADLLSHMRQGTDAGDDRLACFECHCSRIRRWCGVRTFRAGKETIGLLVCDISDKKNGELEMQDSLRLLSEAETAGHVGGWEINLQTRKMTWTDELFRIVDLDPERDTAPQIETGINLYPEHLRAEVMQVLNDLLEHGTPMDREWQVITATGRLLDVHAIGRSDAANNRVYGFFQDISERKQAERELLKSRNMLREAQQLAGIGSWEWDVKSDTHVWSEQIYRIYGHPADLPPAVYPEVKQYFTPESWKKLAATVEHALAAGEPYECEAEVVRPDGEHCWIIARGAAVTNADGEVIRMHGTVQDITERIRLEEQFRQAQKIEALGTLVGGIAHDFNNMLAGIMGNVYLARTLGLENEQLNSKLDTIERLSSKAADMVAHLLTFARKRAIQLSDIDLRAFIKEAMKLVEAGVPENVVLKQDFPDDEIWVMGDAAQLQQIVMNLVNNARDAVEDMPDACITCSLSVYVPDETFLRQLDTNRAERYALFSVQDNGGGIPLENLEKVFDPFFTTKPVGKGTGLGLAMVYGSVMSHQGVVKVSSGKGEGTRFDVYLPLADKAGKSEAVSDVKVIPGMGEHLLVVDDNTELLNVYRNLLESIGYRVDLAADGGEAVALFMQQPEAFDLVILDMVMPVLDGAGAAQRIREVRPDIP